MIEGPNNALANLHCLVKTTNQGLREGVLRGTLPSDELCQSSMEAAMQSAPDLRWTSELQASPATEATPWTANAPGFITAFLNEARGQDRGFLLHGKAIRILNTVSVDQQTRIELAAQELLGSEVELTFEGQSAGGTTPTTEL